MLLLFVPPYFRRFCGLDIGVKYRGYYWSGGDLSLVDRYDGRPNYFGRVWIWKTAPSNSAPDLFRPHDVKVAVGDTIEVDLLANDPDGDSVSFSLVDEVALAELKQDGEGVATLRLAPSLADYQPCPHLLRVRVTDSGTPVLADVLTLQIAIQMHDLFLPVISASLGRCYMH
jgi:hypothetical protein